MAARYSLVLDGTAIKELPVGDTLAGQAASGANADITALTGLTTALSAGQGGTGLASPGTSGNVLTSNGTTWTSGAAPSSNGGATETSSAVDITLTAASTRVQAVSMTASAKSITLPVATTMTTGGALFVIKNTGTITFAVRNSAGTLLAPVAAGQIIGLYLSNNATAAGVWAVGNESTASFLAEILNGASLSASPASADNTAITAMSATQAVVVYVQGTSIRARTLNISGTTITAGTDIYLGLGNYYINVSRLSATQAVIGFLGSPSDRVQLCALDISGTTITAGSMFTTTVYAMSVIVTAVSASQAMCVIQVGYNTLTAFTVNVSGSTITVGPTLAMPATTNPSSTSGGAVWATALSATQVIATYLGTNGYLETCTLNISGTSITSGTVLVVNAMATISYIQVTKLSTTQALVTYVGTGSSLCTQTLNVSGTTVSAGAVLNAALYALWVTCAAISASKVLVCYSVGSETRDLLLTISGTSVAAGSANFIGSGSNNYLSVANLSATQSLLVNKNQSTTYTTATLIEALS